MTIAVEELKGRVPVRAMGCEPRLPSEMVAFLKRAERAKVDAAQIFSLDIGHGAKPTVAELDSYYSTVIGSVALPVVLSSHHLMGYVLPLDFVERLLDRFPSIVGINYGGSDIKYLAAMIARFADRIEVHCGGPRNAVTTLTLGGHGFMGGEGNFVPSLVASVISAFQERDHDRLRESFGKLLAFHTIYGRYGGSAQRAMKPLMNAFGLRAGTLRSPRLPIDQKELDLVVREVIKLGIQGTPARVS